VTWIHRIENSGLINGVGGRGKPWGEPLRQITERFERWTFDFVHADAFVPTAFRGHFYHVSDERGFESLLRHLLHQPGAEAGALGPLGPQGSRWSAFERPWLVPSQCARTTSLAVRIFSRGFASNC
jgi:hypothetical protein